MISNLKIKNFQCHKQAELEFVPGVNVIAGTSDSGKSALLKALLWVLTNKPQGFDFRSFSCEKGDSVEVEIEVDGRKIARRRNEQKNEYALDGKRFVAMKGDVPSDIATILNMAPVNIQTQFAPHYLLSASSSEVAKTLNESCDLSIIDRTIKGINGVIQNAKTRVRVANTQLDSIDRQLSKLTWLETAEARLESLEAENSRIEERSEKIKRLEAILFDLQGCQDKYQESQDLLANFDGLQTIQELIDPDLQDNVSKLQAIISQIDGTQDQLKKLARFPSAKMDRLAEMMQGIAKLEIDIDRLQTLLTGISDLNAEYETIQAAKDQATESLQEFLATFDICPVCGNKM